MRPIIDRLILKRDECADERRKMNAHRRRLSECQRQYHALVKRYEAECIKYCETTTEAPRCACGRTPRAYRVQAPRLTWTVICRCGRRTGYYSMGKKYAVDAWREMQEIDNATPTP